ncbi:MAG TPA: outer membrane protein assembly factor BamD [Gammaproteobacteria bacterium]
MYSDAFIGLVPENEISLSKNSEIQQEAYPAEYIIYNATKTLIIAASNIDLKNKETQKKEAAGVKADVVEPDMYYIVNLKTASSLSEFDQIIKHSVVSKYSLYISELEIDNRKWYQYRIGFFIERKQAENITNLLIKDFPLARPILVSKEEKQVATERIRIYTAEVSPKLEIKPKEKPLNMAAYQTLIKKGTSALSARDYSAAIQAFAELLSYPENPYSMDAQELLGFSYELNKQISNARTEYERYISLYPESKGAERVRQRLASLITARKAVPKELREAEKKDIVPEWEFYGSLSQFYRRDTSSLDINTDTGASVITTTDKRVNLSEIDTLLNVNGRRRSTDYDIRTRFTGGHTYDLIDENDSNKAPINELYVDVLDVQNNLNGRLGRQSSSKGGVLGRFDGLDAGYQISDWLKLNMTTGYHVDSVYESANTDTFFRGVRFDFGTFFNAWDFSLYYIKQDEGDIVGREAVGTEFRYFHPRASLFGLIDHDILFDVTNTILLNGSWTVTNETTLNATIDIRQSPILTARSALQGQTFTSINEMLGSFTEDEILQIAQDRTAEVKTYIIGVSHLLSDTYTINVDVTATSISATEASAGIDALPESGPDYFINTQLVGASIFKQNDTSIVGLNFSDTSTTSSTSLQWNYRIPVTQNLRMNPRISVTQRDNNDGSSQNILGLAYKMDYRWKRNTSFEFEVGSESSDKTLVAGDEKNQVYFLNLGYQYNF